MQLWAWVVAWVTMGLWACGWCQASSPIRISAYGYPDPPGYGRRLSPKISVTRPRRNATFITPKSEINIKSSEDNIEDVPLPEDLPSDDPVKDDDDDQNATNTTITRVRVPVNRMGVAARTTKRKIRPLLQEPRRRSHSRDSTTTRSVGPPSIRPPATPPSPPQGLFGPPAITGFGIEPPAPPVLPPSTPTPTLMGSFGPPAIPPPISSPSPPPGADQAQVSDIKCMNTGTTSSFMAVLSLPVGYNAIPVFEDRPTIDPTINTACRMIPTQLTNDMFQLIVSDLERCGVRECRQGNGETWLCLQLRFPLVNGLKLPEDEKIQIRCRPQDKIAQDTHVLRIATAKYAAKEAINGVTSTSMFEGGQQEFQCEIGLFRKLPGTELFASIVTPEVELDLGEEVQLRSIVRSGDGWQYSRITTIIIQKVGAPRARSILNAADLVFADGCRNPSYKVIARQHPKRDTRNPLINNFTFRMFMFQDMEVGDSLMITANVIGCVDAEDCAPTNCGPGDDDLLGFGKRRKRAVGQFTMTTVIPASDISSSSGPPYPPPILSTFSSSSSSTMPSAPSSHTRKQHENTTNWERNLSVRVKIPDTKVRQESIEAQECRLYLFITLGVAAVFCFSSIVFVVFTLLRGRTKEVSSSTPTPVMGQPPPVMPLQPMSTCSSSLSSTQDSTASICSSHLPSFPVPPTVRQRKRQVNAELLKVFNNECQFPYGTYYPGMLNYYGYMVVPRKTADKSNEKKTLRAMKRDHKRYRIDEPECVCQCNNNHAHGNDELPIKGNHTAIIRISASGTDTVSSTASRPPKPTPRIRKEKDDNIYSEITLDSTTPTMV
ncbi:uncharacterized protein LOC121861696 isoform X1 [Homarus americanus]|uniref:uncharacterized protein LOC121861696 isoform X1 n=1 Tax=Homarus americanus TaxID=6706 RepID=UPI001C481981|nr:uncharacterized protein LOC121861696 isoform X1 [Homarus americanus]XP_042215523.1 uncharacterized protein LOC121861696 isoform X1 [Homarus americanus]XP_042215525.1 uncharacterized protein LOC121861696 isoform X1 [Homarus americanus]XP_042215526.1 uncharacterized protein LOC121861696 isoform X1 [Homarus americanus]